MILHSLTFAGFVLATLLVYYILDHRKQNYLLLVASYSFYFIWSWQFPTILAVVIV